MASNGGAGGGGEPPLPMFQASNPVSEQVLLTVVVVDCGCTNLTATLFNAFWFASLVPTGGSNKWNLQRT